MVNIDAGYDVVLGLNADLDLSSNPAGSMGCSTNIRSSSVRNAFNKWYQISWSSRVRSSLISLQRDHDNELRTKHPLTLDLEAFCGWPQLSPRRRKSRNVLMLLHANLRKLLGRYSSSHVGDQSVPRNITPVNELMQAQLSSHKVWVKFQNCSKNELSEKYEVLEQSYSFYVRHDRLFFLCSFEIGRKLYLGGIDYASLRTWI